jgi:ligand-binding sensor domain-containing protein
MIKANQFTNNPQGWIAVFALYLFSFTHTLHAQSTTFFEQGYEVSHYGAEYGFPYDEIQDIIQDSQGYLWMISSINLIRYDGVKFEYFRPEQDQREYNFTEYFSSLTEDQYGNIWIGTFGDDLWKFDRQMETFERIPYRSLYIRQYFRRGTPTLSKEGNLWLHSWAGILRIDASTNAVDTIFPYIKPDLLNEILGIIPQEHRKPLMVDDEQSQTFTVPHSSKYLAVGIGVFDWYNDIFKETAVILDSDNQKRWQMQPAKSIAVDEKKRICLQILDLEAGTYTIQSDQLTLRSNPTMLTMDSLGNISNSGIYLLPLNDELSAQLTYKLTDIEKIIAPHLTLQNLIAVSKDDSPFLISELHGLFAIKAEQDSFYLEKRGDRIQIEGASSVAIDHYTLKDEQSFWIAGYYQDKDNNEIRYFLGIWDIVSGRFSLLNTGEKPGYQITGLQQDINGNLWIATFGDGLFLLKNTSGLTDKNEIIPLTPVDIFPPAYKKGLKFLRELSIDNNNNLWIGTRERYLYKIDLDPVILQNIEFTELGLEKGNYYFAPVEDDEGNIWFTSTSAQTGGVILRYNNTTAAVDTFTANTHNFPNRYLYPFYKDKDGGVVFGGDHNLIRYYHGEFIAESIAIPDDQLFMTALESFDGPKPIFLLVNKKGRRGGPYHLYNQTINKVIVLPDLEGTIFMFYHDRYGRAYLGTSNGFFEMDLSTGEYKEILPDMPYVFSMYVDEQGRFWLATFMGLAIWDATSDELIYLDESDGLGNANVHEIEEDDHGFLWLFTFRGIFRANPQTLEVESFPQLKGIGKLRVAGQEEVLRDKQGYFNVFSEDGFYRFHPDSLFADTVAPRLSLQYSRFTNSNEEVVDQFNVYGHIVSTDDSYTFPHFQNNVTIEYVGIQLNDPEGVSYRYRLEGLSESWQEVGAERTARFQDLPPGDYTFVAEATSTYWIKSPPLEFSFTILPPWYWAWWSKLLYVLLAGGATYYFYRFQLSKRLAEQETLRLKELDEVKNRLYANITHEFRTPLTVIQGMAQQINGKYQKETKLIRKNSRNLLNLVNQMLDLSKLESGKLHLQ